MVNVSVTFFLQDLWRGIRFTDLDLFNFLGCDVPRPDMVYIITGSQPDVNMYRRDVSSKYLASGKRNTIANPILSLVCVLTSSLLLLL